MADAEPMNFAAATSAGGKVRKRDTLQQNSSHNPDMQFFESDAMCARAHIGRHTRSPALLLGAKASTASVPYVPHHP